MRFAGKFDGAENRLEPVTIGDAHEIRLNVHVNEPDALWLAAAQQLALYGMSQDEIESCIGPRLDMSIADCLKTLVSSLEIAGCENEDIAVIAKGEALATLGEVGLRTLMAELSRANRASGGHLLWPSEDD